MLVKLYTLPDLGSTLKEMEGVGVTIRRPLAPEKHRVLEWVGNAFNRGWVSECEVTFANHPVSCFIALQEGAIVGFSCYEAIRKDFLGPIGVEEQVRRRGVGRALLVASLHALRELDYAYAIIGGAGPTEFYRKTVDAVPIEGSTPGIYRGMLKG
jgi:hypothetical protein